MKWPPPKKRAGAVLRAPAKRTGLGEDNSGSGFAQHDTHRDRELQLQQITAKTLLEISRKLDTILAQQGDQNRHRNGIAPDWRRNGWREW